VVQDNTDLDTHTHLFGTRREQKEYMNSLKYVKNTAPINKQLYVEQSPL